MTHHSHLHSRYTRPAGFVRGKCVPGGTLDIIYDEFPDNPREAWSTLGHMVCLHRRLRLGDEHALSYSENGPWKEIENHLREKCGAVVVLPLYLYDHSEVAMNTTGYSNPWDSGQVGFIYATSEDIQMTYQESDLTPELVTKVKAALIDEVVVYSDYLQGHVYCYEVRDDQGEIVDSCGGYYGDNGIKSILINTGFTAAHEVCNTMRFENTRGDGYGIRLEAGEIRISHKDRFNMTIREYCDYACVPWEEAYFTHMRGEIVEFLQEHLRSGVGIGLIQIDPASMAGIPISDEIKTRIRQAVWNCNATAKYGSTYYHGRIYVLDQPAYYCGRCLVAHGIVYDDVYSSLGRDPVTDEAVQVYWRPAPGIDPVACEEGDVCDWDFADMVIRLSVGA